jgi:hypothetical protein
VDVRLAHDMYPFFSYLIFAGRTRFFLLKPP